MDREIIESEIKWHSENVVGHWTPSYISDTEIEKYRNCKHWKINPKQYMFKLVGEPKGKRILDYGSGQGINGVEFARLGATVDGFDVCPGLVVESNELAKLNKVEEHCRFELAEATTQKLKERYYDVVFIDNVLHHIPTDEYSDLFSAILLSVKPDGRIIIREPVCFFSLAENVKRLFRHQPKTTEHERELTFQDVALLRSLLTNTEIRHYHLAYRLVEKFGWTGLTVPAMWLDRILFFFPSPIRNLAGYVVITSGQNSPTSS